MIESSCRANSKSSAVKPPAEWVDNAMPTLRQDRVMSGWWSSRSAAGAISETNCTAARNVGNFTERCSSVPAIVQSGLSEVNWARASSLDTKSRFVTEIPSIPTAAAHASRPALQSGLVSAI